MEKKFIYEAPEMESIILIKEAVMQNTSDGINSADKDYDSNNDLGGLGF